MEEVIQEPERLSKDSEERHSRAVGVDSVTETWGDVPDPTSVPAGFFHSKNVSNSFPPYRIILYYLSEALILVGTRLSVSAVGYDFPVKK